MQLKPLKMASRWSQEAPKSPQESPRRAQEGPKRPQDGPKRDPRRSQDGPKTATGWLRAASQTYSKTVLSYLNFKIGQDAPKTTPGSPQGAPRDPLQAPQRPPRGPKRPPMDPQAASRRPQEAPRRPQDSPRGTIFTVKSSISCGRGGISQLSYQVACDMSPLGRRRGPALRAQSGGGPKAGAVSDYGPKGKAYIAE